MFYCIRSYRLCGCLFSVYLCIHMIHAFTCFYCKLFDEQPWYRVLGFLVVGVVQTDAQIGNSVLVPSSSSSGILGLLPSTSPYDIIDDGPTWVNFKGMKTPQVSLLWVAPILDDEGFMFGNVYILYRRQTCRVCRLEMFDGNMYVATTSALTWYIVVELFFPFTFPPSAAPRKL